MVSAAKKKLGVYKAKRDFTKTAEPSGDVKVSMSPRPRFVIQKHAATRLHYDLRLEHDGVFRSWAVTRGPSLDPHDKRLAVEVEDHPLDYGDFEGTIPKGEYGGGTVQMWDRGFWEPEGGLTPQDALKKGDFKFILEGDKLHGSWALVRMRRREGEKRDNWLLIKHRDEYAVDGNGDAVLIEDRSVASGRTMAEIAAGKGKKPKPFMLKTQTGADAVWHSNRESGNGKAAPEPKKIAKPVKAEKPGKLPQGKPAASMPTFVQPQLCKSVERAPTGPGWGHEIKLDGYRMQIRVERHKVALRTRKGLDWTEKFSAIAKAASKLPDSIIDGEAVVLDKNGAPSFPLLQTALSEGRSERMVYFAFDLLFATGHDLRDLALRDRKAHLEALLRKAGEAIRYSAHLETSGQSVLEAASKMSLEGIVSKRLDARYKSDRQDTWVKTKCRGGNEVVIGGWSEEDGRFRSLLAGAYKDGRFNYVGRIGTGFGAKVTEHLVPALKAVESKTSPFNGTSVPPKDRQIRWAKPSLVAEVEFGGITTDHLIRQAAFKGLREDKPASEVTFDSLEPAGNPNMKPSQAKKPLPIRIIAKGNDSVRGVTISHPEKELWPAAGDDTAVTKRDLVQYYDAMSEAILDHIKGRPCSIIRAPDGITSQQFFQRHAMKGASKLMTFIKVKGDKEPYLQIDTPEALIAAGQISAVELHPWNCQPGDPETPGRLVFDLDPAPDVDFADVITAAREIHDRLKALGLESFCKTTGGKGLHVVTPFKPEPKQKLEWPAAKAFAQEVCRQMAADSPDRYLINMAKKERVGRIFLDYLRNDRTSTAVAPLSPRARPGAPVSMPVTWAQVRSGLDPSRFNTRTAESQLKKTKAWSDYEKGARPFTAAAKKLVAKAR